MEVYINLFSSRKAFFPMFEYSLRIVEYSSILLIIDYLGLSLNIEHFRQL